MLFIIYFWRVDVREVEMGGTVATTGELRSMYMFLVGKYRGETA
jgi:hypothetical protein